MTKTIMILAIAVAFVAGSIGTGTIAYAGDDGEEEPLLFVWDPAETSSDPANLIAVNADFTRVGLSSDTTSDVQGEFEGLLKADSENNSETTQSTTVGSTTITTTVKAKSQDANDLEGEIQIDGDTFVTKLTLLKSKTTTLEVTDVFSSPIITQTSELKKLTIPVTIEMCSDDDNCFQGFGVLRRESNETTAGGSQITFSTDTLEAELIGETGFFELKMTRFQRTVETIP